MLSSIFDGRNFFFKFVPLAFVNLSGTIVKLLFKLVSRVSGAIFEFQR